MYKIPTHDSLLSLKTQNSSLDLLYNEHHWLLPIQEFDNKSNRDYITRLA